MLYVKDNRVYKTPIQCKRQKTIKLKKNTEQGVKEIQKTVLVDCWTNDQSIILENGYSKYVAPQVKQPTKQDYRYSKRKIKDKLVDLGLWQVVKENLSEDEYQDLLLSQDFAFDDELFVRCYNLLKSQVDNLDDYLAQCRK